jgi:mannose-6-phosphate isomerase-like protein (cupin superfamily)
MDWAINIEEVTRENDDYRRVIWTSQQMQVVLMSLLPGENIGMEVHPTVTQFIRIEEGKGIATRGDEKFKIFDGSAVFIPAGMCHDIQNVGKIPLKLYTIYAPPNHPPHRVQHKKPKND